MVSSIVGTLDLIVAFTFVNGAFAVISLICLYKLSKWSKLPSRSVGAFHPTPAGRTLAGRQPGGFSGDSAALEEWAFRIGQCLLWNCAGCSGGEEVQYAASYLEGDALSWYISCLNNGVYFDSWRSLKSGLVDCFGPRKQRSWEGRFKLFNARQDGRSVEEFIQDISRLNRDVHELDEYSRAVLFVYGLRTDLRQEVLREDPRTLQDAFQAARAADQLRYVSPSVVPRRLSFADQVRRNAQEKQVKPMGMERRRRPLSDSERHQLQAEGRCFKCREVGHLSAYCPERRYPNDYRQ